MLESSEPIVATVCCLYRTNGGSLGSQRDLEDDMPELTYSVVGAGGGGGGGQLPPLPLLDKFAP